MHSAVQLMLEGAVLGVQELWTVESRVNECWVDDDSVVESAETVVATWASCAQYITDIAVTTSSLVCCFPDAASCLTLPPTGEGTLCARARVV